MNLEEAIANRMEERRIAAITAQHRKEKEEAEKEDIVAQSIRFLVVWIEENEYVELSTDLFYGYMAGGGTIFVSYREENWRDGSYVATSGGIVRSSAQGGSYSLSEAAGGYFKTVHQGNYTPYHSFVDAIIDARKG